MLINKNYVQRYGNFRDERWKDRGGEEFFYPIGEITIYLPSFEKNLVGLQKIWLC